MKILIVDDNGDDRRVLRYIIQAHGHEVVQAGNGQEGLDRAAADLPELIISDALMPVMDGFQFLRSIKQDKHLSSIPFIFYSATYRGENDIQLALSLGAAGYIIKPKDPVELWGEVENILAESKEEKIIEPELIEEHSDFLRRYSEVVATKLEEKVQQLEVEIAERRRAEETLKERDAFIRNILESVDEGIIVIDRELRILSANRAFCSLVGAAETEVIGRHCHEVSHRLNRPCYERDEECTVKRTFETGRSFSSEHTHIGPKGIKQTVEIKSYPVTGAGGVVVSAIETINNITEKRRLEDQLRQSQKMEAVGTLAGGVAHDFNNILTAIIGYGNIMKMKMLPNDPGLMPLEHILNSADRAAHLTQGLLAFSRKQVMNPRPVDVNNIVKNVEKLLFRLIGEDVDLKVNYAADDLIVIADAGQIEQVLMNLSTNARDAMPDGGTLTIMTRSVDLKEDLIAADRTCAAGRYALIEVSDTGCGMDEQTKEKLFEPFFTTKELGKGTGLGLSIVYGIVSQHNGAINVLSQPGQGTTFRIYFPLAASHVEENSAVAAVRPQGGNETVILAEDDRSVMGMLSIVLSDFGYKVIKAVDGQDAVDKFMGHSADVALMIIDIIMPKMTGTEVADLVRKTRPDLPVLFISGYSADFLQKKGVVEEDIEFLPKPTNPYDLLNKIRNMLDRKKIC